MLHFVLLFLSVYTVFTSKLTNRTLCDVHCSCGHKSIKCTEISLADLMGSETAYSKLELIKLQFSPIRVLTLQSMRQYEKLHSLYVILELSRIITNSQLESIEPGALSSPSLKYVDLSSNRITKVPWKSAANKHSRLEKLLLQNNPLSCKQCENYWLFHQETFNVSIQVPVYNSTGVTTVSCSEHLCTDIFARHAVFRLPQRITLSSDVISTCQGAVQSDVKAVCNIPVLKMSLHPKTPHFEGDNVVIACSISGAEHSQKLHMKAVTHKNPIDRPQWKSYNQDYGTLTISNATSADSGWYICISSSSHIPLLASQPLLILGKPQVLSVNVLNPGTSGSIMTVKFECLGLPIPKVLVDPEHVTSHEPLIVSDSVSALTFNKLTGSAIFKHQSSWKLLCLGSYKLRACNEFGCDETKFSLIGIPGHCGNETSWEFRNTTERGKHPISVSVVTQSRSTWYVTVLATVTTWIACVIIIALSIIWCTRRRKVANRKKHETLEILKLNAMDIHAQDNQLYFTMLKELSHKSNIPVYDEHEFETLKLLGEGAFGCVYLVQCRPCNEASLDDENGHDTIKEMQKTNETSDNYMAMKLIKCCSVLERLSDLDHEAKILAGLEHPNIVKFYGLSCKNGQTAMLFEFMEYGDLANYLRDNRPCSGYVSHLSNPVTLLRISIQIGEGLSYLSGQHLIHRDLAARNCLVSSGLTVKIADFGMTRELYVQEYYKMEGLTAVPLRWLAPESIQYRKFTVESDIWSYGIVLWEIFTFGQVPWCEYSNHELVNCITSGKIPDAPELCPPDVYAIMQQCWQQEPKDRITIDKLCQRIHKLIQNL